MYRLSVGSTMISSPSVTNGGTCTVTPFSSTAGLYDEDWVAPFTIGWVSLIRTLSVTVGVHVLHLVLGDERLLDVVVRAEAVLELRAGAEVAQLGLHHSSQVA